MPAHASIYSTAPIDQYDPRCIYDNLSLMTSGFTRACHGAAHAKTGGRDGKSASRGEDADRINAPLYTEYDTFDSRKDHIDK
jgi:hypothetical protein